MSTSSRTWWLLVLGVCLVLLPGKAAAFGAGNIPSIAQVEGHNWRHGDIEDLLQNLAFLAGKKWSSMLIKRTYFGNWLRDYSQAVDVGTLKGVNADTIRVLVWVLSFMAFGYATEEFEVTAERLGCYRPEEHIDNPRGYGDGIDARTLDPRLRGPVQPIELDIDPATGMKNYIANERGGWATSAGYLRFSFSRSIHFGRLYTHGAHGRGKEADLCEALRCLGQALHCMEDFGAHSNYCELALRELGHHRVFPHCGAQSEVRVRGRSVFPLVTGTFGGVDFLHSVIGEANDHFTQSEVDAVDIALKNAEGEAASGSRSADRGFLGVGGGGFDFISLVARLPGCGSGFAAEARDLKAASEAQERVNRSRAGDNPNQIPGMSPDFDPVKTARRIYPILQFRDRIVKAISRGIERVPGLEKLLEHISETLTAFILGLLAPFIRPIIKQVSKVLKDGSSDVIDASAHSQMEPWTNPRSSDPTHSMLSKDHFTNVLNSCAGRVAGTILEYTVPRIIYAWENPQVPVDEVLNDVLRAFHHPALRDDNVEIQRDMFRTVRKWAEETPHRHRLDDLLSSESVKAGHNHILKDSDRSRGGGHSHHHDDHSTHRGHGTVAGSLWSQVKTRDLASMEGRDGNPARDYASSSPAPPSRYSPPAQAGFGYGAHSPQPSQYHQGGYVQPAAYPHYHGYDAPPQPQYGGHGHGEASQYYNQQKHHQWNPYQGHH